MIPCLRSVATFLLPLLSCALLIPDSAAQLTPFVTETGNVSVSIDGEGNNISTVAQNLIVAKPPGATVRSAWLLATGHGVVGSSVVADGQVSLAGVPIAWDQTTFNNAGADPDFFHNVLAEVTEIVKPIVDAAAAGTVLIPVLESPTLPVNGTILAVVFDDPGVIDQSTVILLFGGQDTNGDTFVINLAQPIDPSSPNAVADMSLGIGHGFQGATGTPMNSTVTVNGMLLTSAAGGENDGLGFNGALITVGGVGDSNDNPVDPTQTSVPNGFNTDDELYSLIPFVDPSSNQITVDTLNPSDDDNIFFAAFTTSVAAAIGESILLAPPTASLPVGAPHLLTASVAGSLGQPIPGAMVEFEVLAGPNTGLTAQVVANRNGQANFLYSSATLGVDSVVARTTGAGGGRIESNLATVSWCAVASAVHYGPSTPGANGAPALNVSALPVLGGGDVTLSLTSSSASPAPACVLVGNQPAQMTTELGGLVLVEKIFEVGLLLPPAGASFPVTVPSDPALCGATIALQLVQLDPAAALGVAFSDGLLLTFGL
jgi:hypothetical protein